jgi:hypothetical protein
MAGKNIPKAKELYRGDINEAVILVQQAVGVQITPEWWAKNVGDRGTAAEICDRFDRAYQKEVQRQKDA